MKSTLYPLSRSHDSMNGHWEGLKHKRNVFHVTVTDWANAHSRETEMCVMEHLIYFRTSVLFEVWICKFGLFYVINMHSCSNKMDVVCLFKEFLLIDLDFFKKSYSCSSFKSLLFSENLNVKLKTYITNVQLAF